MRIPSKHPRTSHAHSYVYSDSRRGLLAFVRRLFQFFDVNGQATKDLFTIACHWSDLRDYHYKKIGGRIYWDKDARPCYERNWVGDLENNCTKSGAPLWLVADHINMLKGLDRKKPLRRKGRVVGRRVCVEPKGSPQFKHEAIWEKLTEQVGHQQYFVMTLTSIPGWAARLRAAHNTGLQTAVLRRGSWRTWFRHHSLKYVNAKW